MTTYKTWELVRRLLINTTYGYNKEVKAHFKDIWADGGDITTSMRHAFLDACMISGQDSALVALHKRLFFYFEVLGLHRQEGFTAYEENIRIHRQHKPQIVLYFDNQTRDADKLVRGRISFRIMSDSFSTQTDTDAKILGTKIKNYFGGSTPYQWHKGKELYSYVEWEKGYQFQILSNSESEAKKLVTTTLKLQDHTPEWQFFNKVTNDNPSVAFPQTKVKKQVLGEMQETPVYRPIEVVTFRYSTIHVPPFKPRMLYARHSLGLRNKPLVTS